jgi:hypothetical protein
MPKKITEPRPWVVPADEYLSGAGRPRTGPRGRAVRDLPRVTIRAERVALDLWERILQADDRPAYVVFREMVQRYAEHRRGSQ